MGLPVTHLLTSLLGMGLDRGQGPAASPGSHPLPPLPTGELLSSSAPAKKRRLLACSSQGTGPTWAGTQQPPGLTWADVSQDMGLSWAGPSQRMG